MEHTVTAVLRACRAGSPDRPLTGPATCCRPPGEGPPRPTGPNKPLRAVGGRSGFDLAGFHAGPSPFPLDQLTDAPVAEADVQRDPSRRDVQGRSLDDRSEER